MDNKTKLLAASIVSTAVLFNSAATFAASFSATATADIIEPISIAEYKPLDFGAISPPTTTACIVGISETGAITQDSDCGLLGGHSEGEYFITGNGDYDITISVSATTGLLGGLDFTAGSTSSGLTPALWSSPLLVKVGGTLEVPPGTPPGSISGGYDVTADYI